MESSAPEDNLGKIVTDKGWVKPEQLEAAAKLQSEAAAKGEKLRLGEALVRLSAITEEQLRLALVVQDKVTFRCAPCGKNFNVRGYKPGTRIHCKTCNGPLEPVTTSVAAPVSDTAGGELRRTPAGKEIDPALADLVPGYKIERKLGSGGMGDVYLARQASLDRLVAIKILPPELAKDQAYVARFLTEARSAAKVTHENIVASVDAGESKGCSYFIMEYVDGETCHQVMKREGALPEKRALEIARQAARGLKHAHSLGLIHRDVKPANIMLTKDGRAKICDFGLARALNEFEPSVEKGIVQSSPAYASPEQCKGRQDLDHRTDMYSLGVSLFEMLTGRRPFEAETSNLLFIKHATEAPPSPKTFNPAVSLGAATLVLRLLRKQPAQRFDTYDELIAALDKLLENRPARAAAAPAEPAAPVPAWQNPKVRIAAGGIAALALLAWGGSLLVGGAPPPKAVEKAPAAVAKVPPDVERALKEGRDFQEQAAGNAAEYPAVRARWKGLAETYRTTPHHPLFASALLQFDSLVNDEADNAARLALADADRKDAAGDLAAALLALKSFPAGYAGTEAAGRITDRGAQIERALSGRYAVLKDRFTKLLAAEKWDEAKAQIPKLQALLTSEGQLVLESLKNDVDGLAAQVETAAVLAKKKTDPETPAAPVEDKPASAAAAPAPAGVPQDVILLRTPALREDPLKRAASAAAFGRSAGSSALFRAVEIYLSRSDRSWKLLGDRLTLKTPQATLEKLDGQLQPPDKDGAALFIAQNGMKVLVFKDEKVSVNGGAPVKPQQFELLRNVKAPALVALEEYFATLPLERAAAISSQEHHTAFIALAKKIAAAGDQNVDLFQLFACAHMEDLLGRNYKLDAESLKLARFQAAKSGDVWGPAATVNRIALARLYVGPGSILDLKRALDGVGTPADWQTRLLAALAAFGEATVDPRAVSESFQKLAKAVPADGAVAKFCDTISQAAKAEINCADCKALGRIPCKTCTATGMAACTPCKGSGRVPERETPAGFTSLYTVPCRGCKSKGKVLCPTCQGALKAKCTACDGKKVRASIPSDMFKACLSEGLCSLCTGTGSLFAKAAYPCPACEATGRFPVGVAFLAAAGGTDGPPRSDAAAKPAGPGQGLTYQYWEIRCPLLAAFQPPGAPHLEGSTPGFELSGRRRSENYVMRFTGFIDIPADGAYTFYTHSDDGSLLFIDEKEVVNNDGLHASEEKSGKVPLKAGKHSLRVDYSQGNAGFLLEVTWEGPGFTKQPIPGTALSRTR